MTHLRGDSDSSRLGWGSGNCIILIPRSIHHYLMGGDHRKLQEELAGPGYFANNSLALSALKAWWAHSGWRRQFQPEAELLGCKHTTKGAAAS